MKDVNVEAITYSARFQRLSSELLYMSRDVRHETTDFDVDVFGRFWIFSWGNLPPETIFARRDRDLIPLEGPGALFIPPFSVIEWEIRPGAFHFDSFLCTAPLPAGLPEEPVFLPWIPSRVPQSPEECIAIVRGTRDFEACGTAAEPDALSRRAKQLIDESYTEKVLISQIARRLCTSTTVLGRVFKRSYGLTPVAYRGKLRVFDSLRFLLMEDQLVGSAAFKVGFADLSRYNRLFRRQMLTPPSSYR